MELFHLARKSVPHLKGCRGIFKVPQALLSDPDNPTGDQMHPFNI